MPPGAHPLLDEVHRQLDAYFAADLRCFDLPLALDGTPFQRQVWHQLLSVGYGQTASYQDIADAIDNPKAVRAVGAANGRNPVAIIVPCHRISSGARPKLTGYGGGLWRKEWLLRRIPSLYDSTMIAWTLMKWGPKSWTLRYEMDHITKHMGDMLWCKGNYLLYFVSLIQMCYDGVMCGQGFPRGTHL